MILFAILVIIPLIELAIFIKVGATIGIINTLLLCIIMAAAGGYLIRREGLHTFLAAQNALQRGEVPVAQMFDGICIAIAGALMVAPGFFTDVLGFCLLVPPVRKWLRRRLAAHWEVDLYAAGATGGYSRPRDPDIIEAEYERVDEQDKP